MKSPNGNQTFRLEKGRVLVTFVVNQRLGQAAYQTTFKGTPFDRMDPNQMMIRCGIPKARREYLRRLSEGFTPVKVLVDA